jgi:hypothetical protein
VARPTAAASATILNVIEKPLPCDAGGSDRTQA